MDPSFAYSFPAISGIQAKREYYVSMVPLRLVPKVFSFNEEDDVPPDLRAQRVLNKGRLPEMTRYLLDNRDSYVFSAITASIDGKVQFQSVVPGNAEARRIGVLHVDMNARFIINDGQHRRAAIEQAIKDHPDLADESIAVVFFMDQGLSRCQQMFADLNRYAVRPSSSLGVLYDHRDVRAEIVRRIATQSETFRGLVEMERNTLAQRSRRLFTLSAIHSATRELIRNWDMPPDKIGELAMSFWNEVGRNLPEWEQVRTGARPAMDIRTELLHTHGVVLQAIGKAGHALIEKDPKGWPSRLARLKTIDWSRSNPQWEGRTLIGGRVSKADANVQLTVTLLKTRLGLSLSPDEQRVENAFLAVHRETKHG